MVVKAESEGRVSLKLVAEPLLFALAAVPLSPYGSSSRFEAVIVPAIESPPIMPLPFPLIMPPELMGITLWPA
jgi:hypothetical protein